MTVLAGGLKRNCPPIGPYSRTMPKALWRSLGGAQFLVSEVPLHALPLGMETLPLSDKTAPSTQDPEILNLKPEP